MKGTTNHMALVFRATDKASASLHSVSNKIHSSTIEPKAITQCFIFNESTRKGVFPHVYTPLD